MVRAASTGYNPGSPLHRISSVRFLIATSCFLALAHPMSAQSGQSATDTAAARAAATTTGYGAWFGSIPNMDGSGAGILLEGTSVGSPAEKAGLKAGDRILSIGGVRMVELRSMVDVLRARQPGDTVEVVYQRREAMEKVKVVLGVRPAS